MCGIVGYVGPGHAPEVIICGLRRLEYRGYDSAGVALLPDGAQRLLVVKTAGKIAALEKELALRASACAGRCHLGIGHTRWATHGAPTAANAHPHLSANGRIAIVHNGIIENYAALRQRLEDRGAVFRSETDSEVIAHLVDACYEGDLRRAVAAAVEQLEGAFGIAAVSPRHPGLIVAARRGSPVAVGVGDGETIVASDVCAVVSHTTRVVFLDDGDIVAARAGAVDITSARNLPISRELTHVDWDVGRIAKGGFEHFMLKEIHDQPRALADVTRGRLLPADGATRLSGMRMDAREMARVSRLIIAACGTSYYAGMIGKYLFEDFAGLPADVQQAAEFRYRNPIIERDTAMLAVSQSGETADTLAAVREALRKGAVVLGICNVVGSTIAREAGRGVYLHAGPEIGVASTKAFSCQVAVLAMMAVAFGRTRRLSAEAGRHMVNALADLPRIAAAVLERADLIRAVAEKYARARDFFYIGRGYMYPAALEGALKLKEISYIHAEGYHAAELKHGPIALLDSEVPVVAAVPDTPDKVKTLGNMQECRARKSPIIAIATQGDAGAREVSDDVIEIPPCPEFLSAIPVVIAEQLFAYHVARARGCPIDQPRNLAKSVTVE
ncbi:MAG: glutamine--fructose-6-phosphate transaminase (isomerizing) [Lentisphaerae bacterium]|nr:glutamine--fructose-6-phosphate transaminase (isomerizing) [Lentisphaerota bacterium]